MRFFVPLLLLSFSAAPAFAQAPNYSATLNAEPGSERLVARGTAWRCAAGECVSGPSLRRHALVCADLARTAGELRRFAVEGREFSAEELAACNARAR